MNRFLSASVVALLSTAILASCSGGGGGSSSGASSTASVSLSGITSVNYQPGSAIQTSLSTTASTTVLDFNFPANTSNQTGVITISALPESALPVGLHSGKLKFQADPANVFIYAFSLASQDGHITSFDVPVTLGGNLSPSVSAGTALNLAILQSNTWVEVSTINVGANSALTQNLSSTALPGIVALGTYVLYQPAYPWVGTWVGSDVSTCGFYSGPITMTITSAGGNVLNLSYVASGGLTGVYPLTYSGNTATSATGNVTFTLSGNTMYASEPDSCQTGTFTRQ